MGNNKRTGVVECAVKDELNDGRGRRKTGSPLLVPDATRSQCRITCIGDGAGGTGFSDQCTGAAQGACTSKAKISTALHCDCAGTSEVSGGAVQGQAGKVRHIVAS